MFLLLSVEEAKNKEKEAEHGPFLATLLISLTINDPKWTLVS